MLKLFEENTLGIFIILVLGYYLRLSKTLALGMLIISLLFAGTIDFISLNSKSTLLYLYLGIFTLAWIGQFKGGMWESEYSGLIGYVLWKFFVDLFGVYASGFIHAVVFILLISGFCQFSIYSTIKNFLQNIKDKWTEWQERKALAST